MDSQPISSAGSKAISSGVARGVDTLSFAVVDGLAFAAQKGRLDSTAQRVFSLQDLAPFVEFEHLQNGGVLSCAQNFTVFGSVDIVNLDAALRKRNKLWLCPSTRKIGFFRLSDSEEDQAESYNFGISAQRAAIEAGFSKQVAGQLVAAVLEMIDNVYLHSQAIETGIAIFHSRPGIFDFVVADRGIGVLKSLRQSSEYKNLVDHGDALQIALTDGCSRFGSDSKHGHGFRSLFVGLSNLNGSLRFRTGDHALTIDGRDPGSIPWRKIAKPEISGFLASVSCRTNAVSR